ncbi:MAG TPA: hypothetical protein VFV27_05185 [Nevskiaceae bacterium]|nr:hypothetical protein [Nevskiaceae bacterium]
MNRVLAHTGLLLYVLLAAAALLWWAPNFFAANLHAPPALNYRYLAGSGIPLGLLVMSVAARQSILPRFSLKMLMQVAIAGLLLLLGLMTFQFLAQSVFFCAMHLFVCLGGLLWNLYGYHRELKLWDKRRAAANA